MSRALKILRSPSLMYNYSGIPPFGLATICAELRSKGFDIEQDDLDAKCAADELFPRHRWGKQFPAKDLMLDIDRIRRFWEGGDDRDVVDVVEQVLSYADIEDRDTILLSCIEGDDPAAVLALCIGKVLRERMGKMVVLGGEAFPHMQPIRSEVGYFYEHGCFDYYIQGYGEGPLVALFARLDEGRPVHDVPGLVYPDGEGLTVNPPLFKRPEVVPDFDGLPMHLYYKIPDDWGRLPPEDEGVDEILILPVKLVYNCPMNCAFCIESGDAFSTVTFMTPSEIATGIERLRDRYDTPYFMFADDLFNAKSSHAEEMAQAFVDHNLDIMWSDCAYGRNLSAQSLQLFRRSGARRLVWGLESGSERMHTTINKGIELDEFAQIMRWSHEAGIYNSIEVMAGLPGETDDDIDETIEYIRRLRPYLDQMYLNPFSLITGSLMQRRPEDYGLRNVKPVATIFERTPDEVYSWIQRFTFDDGQLRWKDKIRQIEGSYRRLHDLQVELDLGGHDLHTLFQRFSRYGDKSLVSDFQSSREHQGFDYFDREGQRGHSPVRSVDKGD